MQINAGLLALLNDAIYSAYDPDIWNGAVGICYSQFANGVSGTASDGSYVLEVAQLPPGNTPQSVKDASIVDWTIIKQYNANADAKQTPIVPAGASVYAWAEIPGVRLFRVRCSAAGSHGCWVSFGEKRG